MKDTWLKATIRSLFFPPGAVRTIRFGPMRGMIFRVGPTTGMSPYYSGAEREHQRAFKRIVQPGDMVVDIGANWGLHTLYLSRLVGRDGSVVAIEIFPPAFAELEWHIRANACRNVKILHVGISDFDGDAVFYPGSSNSTGSLSAACITGPIQKEPISVPVRTLDSAIKDLGLETVKLVKVDVEGGEGNVLSGSEGTTKRCRPYFVIDLHTPEQDLFVARWFADRRYRLERLSGPPIIRTDVGWPDPKGVWGSVLASPDQSDS